MISSGIQPIDGRIGGLAPGHVHLLAGGVGTGKSTAGLQFLAAGARVGERVSLVTGDTPAQLAAHADHLGFDVEKAMHRRWVRVLRFRRDFTRRLAGATPGPVIDELRREWTTLRPPQRLVIDPVSPFLADDRPSDAAITAILDLIEEIGVTALLTWPGPVAGGEDRRLDPLIERATVVASLSQGRRGGFVMRIDRARLTGAPQKPIPFTVVRGQGIVEATREGAEHHAVERLPAAGVGGS